MEPTYDEKQGILIATIVNEDYSDFDVTVQQITEMIQSLNEDQLFSVLEYIRIAISEWDTIEFIPYELLLGLDEVVDCVEDENLKFLIENILMIANDSDDDDNSE